MNPNITPNVIDEKIDENFMRLAIQCARLAEGRTSPNPMVGAVIVQNGRIVATGWHRAAGMAHAEINALNVAGAKAKGATMYVNLEPCAHRGRTGPCAEAVAKAGIKRVVAAILDPNPKVAGKGAEFLRRVGVEFSLGTLAAEATRLNEVFLTWIQQNRPFVTLKTAMTLDGKIATANGESKWITGREARNMVHRWRDLHDGIMVGINTIIKDNPSLTTRLPDGCGHNPHRIVVDSQGRIPLEAQVLTDKLAPTTVVVTTRAPRERLKKIMDTGVEVMIAGDGATVDLPLMMQELAKREICSVLAEGGGTLAFSLLKANLVDKIRTFIAPKILGGRLALTPVEGEGFATLSEALRVRDLKTEKIGEDVLLTGYVRKY